MADTKKERSKHQPKQVAAVYRRLLVYLSPYRGKFILALASMVVYGATDGVVPLLIRSVLDDVFGASDRDHASRMLYLLPLLLIVFAIIRSVFGFLQSYLSSEVGLGIIKDIRNDISKKLLNLSASFFSDQSTGSLIARMTNDTLLVRTALTDSAAALIRDSVRVIALLITALYLDPILGVVAFIGFPLGIRFIMQIGQRVRKLSRVGQDQFGGLTGLLQETIVGHKVVAAFSMEDFERARFERENERVAKTFLKAEKYGALIGPINEFLASLIIGGVIFYGGVSVINNIRTEGQFVAFITALFLLYDPLKKIGRVNNNIQAGVSAAERIFELLDSQPAIKEEPDAQELITRNPQIEFKNVSFIYKQDQIIATTEIKEKDIAKLTLNNISLLVKPGRSLALVGMSGGGKSTLVSLLPRFYDPDAGQILIDGKDIRSFTLKSLRRAIAVVDQHTFLFNDTIFSNIAYGKTGSGEDEVIAAAKAAHAHDFIIKLPQGYQTIIGEQGLRLSGGERSRISIARSLLKDAPILILDEATAALDSESERLVQAAIDQLMKGRTVLVIAHRLATVRRADQISVVVGGEIVEQGTHDELLDKGGEYAKLHRIQFSEQRD